MAAKFRCDIFDIAAAQTRAYIVEQTIEQINCFPRDWRPLHYNDAKNVPLIPRKPILHYIFHPLSHCISHFLLGSSSVTLSLGEIICTNSRVQPYSCLHRTSLLIMLLVFPLVLLLVVTVSRTNFPEESNFFLLHASTT